MQMIQARRAAFTLVEVIVAMVLLGIVGSAIVTTAIRGSRSSRAATELSELRDQLNEGAAVLAGDLRAISLAGGDVYPGTMGKSALEFRSSFGSSVVCELHSPNSVTLPANSDPDEGARLTYLYKRIEPGHGAFFFDEGPTDAPEDDGWAYRIITAVGSDPAPCDASQFAVATAGMPPGMSIALNADLPATVRLGAPVRFAERVRYALYQSSDSKWYLGYCASNNMTVTCSTLQPVSGPYSPPNANQSLGLGGLDFFYFDEFGAQTSNPADVARIDVALRGTTAGRSSLAGTQSNSQMSDSVRISVAVRNR